METSERLAQSIYFGLGAAIVIGILWWLFDTPPGGSMSRYAWMRALVMSRYLSADDQADVDQQADSDAFAEDERNFETYESSIVEPKDEGKQVFQFHDTFVALARLCVAGKLTESDALRIGVDVRPGGSARYKEARWRLTVALHNEQVPHYPPLTQEQIDNRHALDLPIKK